MQKIFLAITFVCLLSINASAQTMLNGVDEYVDKGIALNDKGDYKGAIKEFEKALKTDEKSDRANYEIANTLIALKEYQKAMDYADKVIAIHRDFVDQALVLKGTAYDMMGKPKLAIEIYKKAIQDYSDNYLLYYNLAITCYSLHQYKDAEDALQKSVRLKPTHASSHMLLSYVMADQGMRVQSLLALYSFLLLEPQGNRAKDALALMDKQMKRGVQKNGNSISISVSDPKKDNQFSSIDMFLSLHQALDQGDKSKDKTEGEIFVEDTRSFFSILSETKKDNTGFWWDYYVDFYQTLATEKYIEPLSYYISQSRENKKIDTWLKKHKDEVDALKIWSAGYKRK